MKLVFERSVSKEQDWWYHAGHSKGPDVPRSSRYLKAEDLRRWLRKWVFKKGAS